MKYTRNKVSHISFHYCVTKIWQFTRTSDNKINQSTCKSIEIDATDSQIFLTPDLFHDSLDEASVICKI